jgi:hypothetical protein
MRRLTLRNGEPVDVFSPMATTFEPDGSTKACFRSAASSGISRNGHR